MSEVFECVATCRPGLEAVLEGELHALGLKRTKQDKRAVTFWTDLGGLYRANMGLRAAVQLLRPLRTFNARSYDLLYHQVRKTPWHQLFGPEKSLRVDVTGQSKDLSHTQFVTHRVKDAIVDTFKRLRDGQRPSVDKREPEIHVVLHMRGDKMTLCMDSSGVPLFKRGYRLEHGEAPIKEDLAAGLLLAAGLQAGQAMVDPMCGSGTFLFEGWMILAGVAPNLGRQFAFQNWADYDHALHLQEIERLQAAAGESPAVVRGADVDPAMVSLAREIQQTSFPEADIEIEVSDITAFNRVCPGGLMVANPPYGERIGAEDQLGQLYRDLGEAAKRTIPGGRLAVFTTNRTAARQIRMQQLRGRTFFNGALEGLMYEFEVRGAAAAD